MQQAPKLDKTITDRKAQLQRMLVSAASGSRRDDIRVEQLPDAIDLVQSIADRELAITQLDQQNQRAAEIKDAIRRIDEGTYGICEECETRISPRRLDAVPFARLCVPCQEREEARAGDQESAWDAAA